jgi:hypothetical protein
MLEKDTHIPMRARTYDGTLRTHKNPAGYLCYGTYGTYVRTKY